jgi:hypothetical protein
MGIYSLKLVKGTNSHRASYTGSLWREWRQNMYSLYLQTVHALRVTRTLLGTVCLLALVMSGLQPDAVFAASLESLVMPGPLSQPHAELEESCSNCHDAFNRSTQRQLCLDCHEDVAADLNASSGFHGLHPQVQGIECKQCHTEHQGRETDITGLEADLFNHEFTDFPLTDAHAEQTCSACHSDDVPFRETASTCVGCHEADDAHDGALGSECESCHVPSAWRDASFDHDTTEFPLQGVHADTSCASCHSNQTYVDTPMTCISCHKADDVHDGSRGESCGDCHSSSNWNAEFDHLAETGFALEGAHADLACANCHVTSSGQALEALPTDCQGCHSSDDVHLGRHGTQCADCHKQSSWKVSFDHLDASGFALTGSHGEATCEACHTGRLTDPLPEDCWGCHERDDPHGGTLLECDDCHGDVSFSTDLRFHHDLARFALVGLHRSVSCEQCHDSLVFAPQDSDCVNCHKDEDVHKGSLGDSCSDCHNPVGWDYWEFDHAATGFALTGAHEDLTCESCHAAGADKAQTQSSCVSCHRSDDKHHGAFGARCDRCHQTSSFAELDMGRP